MIDWKSTSQLLTSFDWARPSHLNTVLKTRKTGQINQCTVHGTTGIGHTTNNQVQLTQPFDAFHQIPVVLFHPVSATFVGVGQVRQEQLPFVGDLLSNLFLFQPPRFFPCSRGRLLFQQFLVPLLQIFRGPLFLAAGGAAAAAVAAVGAAAVVAGRGSTQGAD